MEQIHKLIAEVEWPVWANYLTVDSSGAWFWGNKPVYTGEEDGWQKEKDDELTVVYLTVPEWEDLLDEYDSISSLGFDFENCIFAKSEQELVLNILKKYEFEKLNPDEYNTETVYRKKIGDDQYLEVFEKDINKDMIERVWVCQYASHGEEYNNELPITTYYALTHLIKACLNLE